MAGGRFTWCGVMRAGCGMGAAYNDIIIYDRSTNDLKDPGATALAPSLACLTGLKTLYIECVCVC